MRSAEQRARRAEKERQRRAAESPASKRRNSVKKRERRAAESPASRQARLASDKAATRRHRQALESSIAENHHMRAEHCSQAAVVAEARCARRDATHSDARVASLMFRLPRSYERAPSLSSQACRRLGCS